MKVKRRVYKWNGRYVFERTSTTGRVTAIEFKSKELAERMLHLAETYIGKEAICKKGPTLTIRGKITNVGFLYERGDDEAPTEVFHIRDKDRHDTFMCKKDACEIV